MFAYDVFVITADMVVSWLVMSWNRSGCEWLLKVGFLYIEDFGATNQQYGNILNGKKCTLGIMMSNGNLTENVIHKHEENFKIIWQNFDRNIWKPVKTKMTTLTI